MWEDYVSEICYMQSEEATTSTHGAPTWQSKIRAAVPVGLAHHLEMKIRAAVPVGLAQFAAPLQHRQHPGLGGCVPVGEWVCMHPSTCVSSAERT